MQKIEFGTGVMFGKKHGQVASSVSKMLVGPQKGFALETSSINVEDVKKYATQSINFDPEHHRLNVGLRVVDCAFIESLFNPRFTAT